MNLYNLIPWLNGYKTVIGTYALIILGLGAFLIGLGNFFTAIGHCVQSLQFDVCSDEIVATWEPLVVGFAGLTGLGIGHKMEKAKFSPK